jgi:hypothetical protein
MYKMSLKECISRVLWNSNIFDFCRSVAYCGTKQKNRGYVGKSINDRFLIDCCASDEK